MQRTQVRTYLFVCMYMLKVKKGHPLSMGPGGPPHFTLKLIYIHLSLQVWIVWTNSRSYQPATFFFFLLFLFLFFLLMLNGSW